MKVISGHRNYIIAMSILINLLKEWKRGKCIGKIFRDVTCAVRQKFTNISEECQ
jgi:hypothetical protein